MLCIMFIKRNIDYCSKRYNQRYNLGFKRCLFFKNKLTILGELVRILFYFFNDPWISDWQQSVYHAFL